MEQRSPIGADYARRGKTMPESAELAAPISSLSEACVESLLALADDELIIGHRHSEWLGLSPFLEEDLTMSSIAQDEFGHARALYSLIWPAWEQRDAGVTRRPASQWRSCQLVESEGAPWERSLVRHALYDLAESFRWSGISTQFGDQVSGLPALVATVLAEERFHVRHATELIGRLAQYAEARGRLNTQFAALAPLVSALRTGMTDDGWANFVAQLEQLLERTGLTSISEAVQAVTNGDRIHRSPEFASIQTALLEVVAFDPSATW
jgi:ring-1,2-phenylacetyl-CoA epoxidase subunit PaaC